MQKHRIPGAVRHTAALWLLPAALLLLVLSGCPKPGDGGDQGGQGAPGATSGGAETPQSGAQPGAGGDAGLKSLAESPSAADYLSGKAGTEVVNTADGQAMPQGWPMAELLPPPGSTLLPDAISRQAWSSGAVQWVQDFSNEDGWPLVHESIESSLRAAGFQLVRGDKTPVEPELGADGLPASGFAKAERSYRSSDGKTLVFLRGELRRVAERPQDPLAKYQLQLIYFDLALPIPGTTTLEDL